MSSEGAQSGKSIDLSRFAGDFLQEAMEHLVRMESLLVAMDPSAPNVDDVNAIFRAAHSIKGGSGMFGFADTTTLTHELESLLDKVRKSELALTADIVGILLEAADLLRAQLEFRAQRRAPPDVDLDALCGRIRACVAVVGAPPAHLRSADPNVTARILNIAYPAGTLDDATTTELFAQLAELGTLDTQHGADADGQRRISLVTTEREEVVLTLFDFVMDARHVHIETEAPRQPGSSESRLFEARPEKPVAVDKPQQPASVSVSNASAHHDSIRVSVDKIDLLLNQVGELVITQAMLAQSIEELDPVHQARLLARIADLQRNTRDLQESVMSIRMLPIASVFARFPRLARDLAAKLGKEVQVRMEGETTELDKGLIELVMDPLVHLVRNAIDHGIERVEDRLAAGKPRAGVLTLRAHHQGGNILVEVADDGRGLSRDKIMAKARERGFQVSDTLTDREVWAFVFEPGFSTADVVTDISGRGVGMDVVKKNIASLGGSIVLESVQGSGTRISIRLPLTLAIMDGLAVGVGDERYIIPLAGILESLQVDQQRLRSVAGQGVVVDVRNEFVPVVYLSSFFGIAPRGVARAQDGPEMIVVVETEGAKVALAVDELLGQNQVVVKSLDANYRRVRGLAGATIMGDGRVACILDLAAIVRHRASAPSSTVH